MHGRSCDYGIHKLDQIPHNPEAAILSIEEQPTKGTTEAPIQRGFLARIRHHPPGCTGHFKTMPSIWCCVPKGRIHGFKNQREAGVTLFVFTPRDTTRKYVLPTSVTLGCLVSFLRRGNASTEGIARVLLNYKLQLLQGTWGSLCPVTKQGRTRHPCRALIIRRRWGCWYTVGAGGRTHDILVMHTVLLGTAFPSGDGKWTSMSAVT